MRKRWTLPVAAFWALLALSGAQAGNPAAAPPMGNPASTLQLTAATSAYGAGQFIASSATAGSVVVPSLQIMPGSILPRLRLSINDPTSTGWGGVGVQLDLWSTAPTFANGDRGAWSVSTGAGAHLATFTCTLSAVAGDGVYGECAPNVGTAAIYALVPATVYWTAQTTTATGVTGASKVMTLTAETAQ
jgi:hypothetical protein